MTLTQAEIDRRKVVHADLLAKLEKSAPGHAAYVVNNLTVHNPDLLALAAVTFARPEIERLLALNDDSASLIEEGDFG